MPTVVGIRFKKAGKIYYFDPALSSVTQGDHAIVETARGIAKAAIILICYLLREVRSILRSSWPTKFFQS